MKDEVRATVAMLLAVLAGDPPEEPARIRTEVLVRASTVRPGRTPSAGRAEAGA